MSSAARTINAVVTLLIPLPSLMNCPAYLQLLAPRVKASLVADQSVRLGDESIRGRLRHEHWCLAGRLVRERLELRAVGLVRGGRLVEVVPQLLVGVAALDRPVRVEVIEQGDQPVEGDVRV